MLYKVLLGLPLLAAAQPTGSGASPTSVAEGAECAGCPNGAVLKGMCYTDLATAISKSITQDTIKVVGTNYVKAPINFGHDLTLTGVTCDDKRAQVVGDFNDPLKGLLNMKITLFNGNASEATGYRKNPEGGPLYQYVLPNGYDYIQVVNISGIDFTPKVLDDTKTLADTDVWLARQPVHEDMLKQHKVVQRHCGLRGPDFDTEYTPGQGTLNLHITDSSFSNFICGLNGSAIYLPTANELKTNDLVVHNNMVYRDIEIYGGGALYIGVNYFGSAIDIGGNFTNNKVMFVYKNDTFAGSEHGEGGAIKFDWVEGTPLIRGYFANNYAPDGAAIQVMELQSTDAAKGIHIRGNFVNNQALNTGAGARGGVLRILNVNASVTLDGLFKNNFADERGAVMAVNWVSARSNIVLNGNFYNNTSVRKGPVYSQISQFNGNLTIKGVSVFAGNKVVNWTEYDPENKTTILWIGRNMNVRLGEAQWNATYAPNRTDFVLIGPPGVSTGAINNWLLPDGADVDTNATSAQDADKTGPRITGGDTTEDAAPSETTSASAAAAAQATTTTTANKATPPPGRPTSTSASKATSASKTTSAASSAAKPSASADA